MQQILLLLRFEIQMLGRFERFVSLNVNFYQKIIFDNNIVEFSPALFYTRDVTEGHHI